MKITLEHYQTLATAIEQTLSVHNVNGALVEAYQTGQFHNADKTKDLQKRFCFDLLFGSGMQSFVCKSLYSYLNDDHIYTALKRICPSVTKVK